MWHDELLCNLIEGRMGGKLREAREGYRYREIFVTTSWLGGSVVEHWSLIGELLLVFTRPEADG